MNNQRFIYFNEQKKELLSATQSLHNTIHFPRMELLDSTEHTAS